jgi:hypothetical protein
LALTTRTAGVSLRELAKAVAGPIQAAVAMATCVLGARLALLDHLSGGPRLVVLIALGLVVYLALCWWRAPEIVEDIRQARSGRPNTRRPPLPGVQGTTDELSSEVAQGSGAGAP